MNESEIQEYKCTHHQLDIVCRGCVMATYKKYNKLLEFIRSTCINFKSPEKHLSDYQQGYTDASNLICETAEKLLKGIGEL